MTGSVRSRGKIRQRSGQSAMEFLMTYGWSILIIGIVVAALFQLGVFSFGSSVGSGSCVSVSGYSCIKGSMNTAGAVSFTFGHLGVGGGAVNITAIGCSNSTAPPTIGWSSTAVNVTTLYSGQSETVIAPCSLSGGSRLGTSFKGTVWVQYITGNGAGGVQEQEVGTVNYAVSSATQPITSTAIAIPGSSSPALIAYNPSNGYMYMVDLSSRMINVISGTTIITTISGFTIPYGIAYNPTNGDMYVVDAGDGTVSVISGTSIIGSPISVGTYPQDIAYNPSNGDMYVTNFGGRSVSVISGMTTVATITVGTEPYGVAYNPSNGDMYVANADDGTVSVISGTSLIGSPISVGTYPQDIAYNPSNGDMYVTNQGSGTVSVISGMTTVATITVGTEPSGVSYNPSNGDMYVTNQGSVTVSVISGMTTVATITVGTEPDGVAYNPSNGDMYVANFGGSSVSVISGMIAPPVTTTVAACFAWGTPVITPDGNIPIQDIKDGTTVYSFNSISNKIVGSRVIQTFRNFTYYTYAINTSLGEVVTTKDHPFYVGNNTFVPAGNLSVGNSVGIFS